MPDPLRLLKTIDRAIALTRATPGRVGRLVRLDAAAEVLVVGDLHGNIGNFQRVIKLADLTHHPNRHLVMQELIHGHFTYDDGSDKSHQALDLWCALKCQSPNQVHLLLGNHELSQWTDRWIAKGENDLNAQFRDGADFAYGAKADEVYAAYLRLFAACPLAARTPNRVFLSHSMPSARHLAGFDPKQLESENGDEAVLHPGGWAHAMVWGRDTGPATAKEFLRKLDADLLITGHIAAPDGFAVPNDRQLILDSLASPAGYCLFPADRPLSHADLLGCVKFL
jgi:Calcineurin-like phosphoesterase